MEARAAAEAARESGFVLTARAENWLHGIKDADDTLRRLRAYAEAGESQGVIRDALVETHARLVEGYEAMGQSTTAAEALASRQETPG